MQLHSRRRVRRRRAASRIREDECGLVRALARHRIGESRAPARFCAKFKRKAVRAVTCCGFEPGGAGLEIDARGRCEKPRIDPLSLSLPSPSRGSQRREVSKPPWRCGEAEKSISFRATTISSCLALTRRVTRILYAHNMPSASALSCGSAGEFQNSRLLARERNMRQSRFFLHSCIGATAAAGAQT